MRNDGFMSSESIPEYLDAIQESISEETKAIQLYDALLGMSNIPASAVEVLKEIRDDEKDHLAILSALLIDEVEEVMPDSGDIGSQDEDDDQYTPVVDGGLFIVSEDE